MLERGMEAASSAAMNIEWKRDFGRALEEARGGGKMVLLDFSAAPT
jgi:hypothetical protein